MKKDNIFLFLLSFLVLCIGFILSNALAVLINCIFNGFDSFFSTVLNLPFVLYAIFSLIISIAFTIFINNKTRPK